MLTSGQLSLSSAGRNTGACERRVKGRAFSDKWGDGTPFVEREVPRTVSSAGMTFNLGSETCFCELEARGVRV